MGTGYLGNRSWRKRFEGLALGRSKSKEKGLNQDERIMSDLDLEGLFHLDLTMKIRKAGRGSRISNLEKTLPWKETQRT